jgi:2-oxo-3-hexenedioate decarboxylase
VSPSLEKWADYLLAAADERRAVPAISKSEDLTLAQAYEIQELMLAKRLRRGERLIGAKLGLTSKAKQQQMKVNEPVYGWLTSSMPLGLEEPVPIDKLIHPRCEPELVFTLGRALEGPGVTAQDVLQATRSISGGIEIIDSRYEAFSFTLADVVADNTSAARYVVGLNSIAPGATDLALLGCVFEANGELLETAAGAALLGHPAECVAKLANHLGRRGAKLAAGFTILAGALTSATPISAGMHATATYAHLGQVTVRAPRAEEKTS